MSQEVMGKCSPRRWCVASISAGGRSPSVSWRRWKSNKSTDRSVVHSTASRPGKWALGEDGGGRRRASGDSHRPGCQGARAQVAHSQGGGAGEPISLAAKVSLPRLGPCGAVA